MGASHFKGSWSFGQRGRPSKPKGNPEGILKIRFFKHMYFWWLWAFRNLEIEFLGKK